jgi:hypothetical protein
MGDNPTMTTKKRFSMIRRTVGRAVQKYLGAGRRGYRISSRAEVRAGELS